MFLLYFHEFGVWCHRFSYKTHGKTFAKCKEKTILFVHFKSDLQVQWQTLRHTLEECVNGDENNVWLIASVNIRSTYSNRFQWSWLNESMEKKREEKTRIKWTLLEFVWKRERQTCIEEWLVLTFNGTISFQSVITSEFSESIENRMRVDFKLSLID